MTTYQDLQDYIAKELRGYNLATETGQVDLIKSNILWAIRRYQHKMFWFNHATAYMYTVPGQEKYAMPTYYLSELTLSGSDINNTQRWTIERSADSKIDIQQTRTGRPKFFSIWAEQIRLSPIPDAPYPVYMNYVKSLPTLFLNTDTNLWLDHAFDLLAFTAEARLALIPYENPGLSAQLSRFAKEELDILEERTFNSLASGIIYPQEL